jgi:hypothetical protein
MGIHDDVGRAAIAEFFAERNEQPAADDPLIIESRDASVLDGIARDKAKELVESMLEKWDQVLRGMFI